jgi:predicted lipoprotein
MTSTFSSNDEPAPVLPPKRDKPSVSFSTTIIANRARTTNGSVRSAVTEIKPDKDNDQCIQLIVDDINHIVEKYTRELDDAIRTKTAIRSPSIEQLSDRHESTIRTVPLRHHSIDTLYETQISRIMKSTVTKTTVNNGLGITDRKQSCRLYNETDCYIQSPDGNFQTQKFTFIDRQKINDQDEQQQSFVTSQIKQLQMPKNEDILNEPPPLPPKRKTGPY